ncbi:hypothetical protein HGM15179_012720, partial [Zosterops borbonicus]
TADAAGFHSLEFMVLLRDMRKKKRRKKIPCHQHKAINSAGEELWSGGPPGIP